MASKKLLEKLNDAIAREIQVSIQYMWQHVMVRGIWAETVGGVFKKIAIVEMKHAEAIAERLDYLGGEPTTKPTPIDIGKKAGDMLKINKKSEEDAIKLYKEIISIADSEGDLATGKLFRDILLDEEDHHKTFSMLLEE